MSEAVGIAGVRFLNARPLTAGLEAGLEAPFAYRFSTAEPATCAEMLAASEAVAGLVPVAALAELADVRALPGLGVAARREVTSVLLVSRVPPERIEVLAAHAASRTSIVLARLLLAQRWGVAPRVVTVRPPLETMLEEADAAVIIGDPALAVAGRTGLLELDLAGAWSEWTGLPFVFAVWGLSPAAPDGTARLLADSLLHAETHWGELLPHWAAAHRVTLVRTRAYLEERLTFRLGPEERRGMEEFLARAARAGLLPAREGVWRAA